MPSSPSHPNHRPHIHRADTVRLHGSPGEAVSLDDFIEDARGEITAADLLGLRRFRSQIEAKLSSEQARQHHDLREGTETLLGVIESDRVDGLSDPIPQDLAEAAVALRYLLKGIDLIPDSVPEIGLTDDARLVAKVLDRNPGLVSGS